MVFLLQLTDVVGTFGKNIELQSVFQFTKCRRQQHDLVELQTDVFTAFLLRGDMVSLLLFFGEHQALQRLAFGVVTVLVHGVLARGSVTVGGGWWERCGVGFFGGWRARTRKVEKKKKMYVCSVGRCGARALPPHRQKE